MQKMIRKSSGHGVGQSKIIIILGFAFGFALALFSDC